MKKVSEIKYLGREKRNPTAFAASQNKSQDVEIKGKITGSDLNERIPPDTWRMLQQAGGKAAERLHELLHSAAFDKLRPSDQATMINLALTRAFGQPDAAVKREIKVKLSNASTDAVSAALERLAGSITLPEHAITPSDDDKA